MIFNPNDICCTLECRSIALIETYYLNTDTVSCGIRCNASILQSFEWKLFKNTIGSRFLITCTNNRICWRKRCHLHILLGSNKQAWNQHQSMSANKQSISLRNRPYWHRWTVLRMNWKRNKWLMHRLTIVQSPSLIHCSKLNNRNRNSFPVPQIIKTFVRNATIKKCISQCAQHQARS